VIRRLPKHVAESESAVALPRHGLSLNSWSIPIPRASSWWFCRRETAEGRVRRDGDRVFFEEAPLEAIGWGSACRRMSRPGRVAALWRGSGWYDL